MENLLGGQTDSVNVGELERSALELGTVPDDLTFKMKYRTTLAFP